MARAVPKRKAGTDKHVGKGARTRARILSAARIVFERDGYADARVVDIVTEAGFAHGTFYTYFSSKQEVFVACQQLVAERLMHTYDLPPDLDPVQRVRATNQRFIELYEENSRMLALLEHAAEIDAALRALRLSIRSAFTERLEGAIRRMNEVEGTSSSRLDPHTAANALGSMVDNVCYVWFGLHQSFDRETMLSTLDTIWTLALGLEPAAARPSR
jgi:AcrR family transcriptional regulator